MIYRSTKTFTPEAGFSCVFRQHKADSHCRFLHGYALWFKFTFEARFLDERGWVVDFGALKPLKDQLADCFDHKLVIARDDPWMNAQVAMEGNTAETVVMDGVGCEAFAKFGFDRARDFLRIAGLANRVFVFSCEVGEHGANSASFTHAE